MIANEHEYYFPLLRNCHYYSLSKASDAPLIKHPEATRALGLLPGLADITGESMASMPVQKPSRCANY